MTQLTVRGVDANLHEELKARARQQGLSVNRYILKLLREATGEIEPSGEQPQYHDLDHLAGTWSVEDAKEFEEILLEQRHIDEGMWRE